jgi:hypothetical protein
MGIQILRQKLLVICLLTHPTLLRSSSLSSASGKEGFPYYLFKFLNPLYTAGEERVVQRSVDRVSPLQK